MTRIFLPTTEQQAIISLADGAHLVVAPPGTGKTQVLTERIIRLLRAESAGTFRLLALTFTTKAAENLRRRVENALGDDARRVTASTFHAFCLDVLQHYGDAVGFSPDTTVYDNEDDRLAVLARSLEEEGLPPPEARDLRATLARIGALKRSLTAAETTKDRDLATAYVAYDRTLRRFHACDFDDLLALTWRLFNESPRVARHFRKQYRHIMIDEAQDTSRAQYEVLRAICGTEHRNVMLVADSDQFIYRFAGASDRWLVAFQKNFDAQVHNLTASFRCGKSIIDAANRLIVGNHQRLHDKVMRAGVAAPGHLESSSYPNEQVEAVAVVEWVQSRLEHGLDRSWCHVEESLSLVPEDACILGRNRYCLDEVRSELEKRGIAYVFNAGQRGLVETPLARLLCQVLKLVQNPADRVTKESVLAEWAPALLDEGAVELTGTAFFQRLASAAPQLAPIEHELAALDESKDLAASMRVLLGALLVQPVGEDAKALIEADHRTLTERWEAYRNRTTPAERSIPGFLGELALAGRSVVEGPGIRVLTVHAAKGLEFRVVVVVGMNEGTFPDYRSTGDQLSVAEERRAAYVAVTRASRALLMTRPRVRTMPWGDTRPQRESRFIAELGVQMVAL